jgi:chromate transport protein ChrA
MSVHSLDVILFIAIIIEVLALLSWDKPLLKYIIPVILAVLGAITLFVYLSGQDKIGYVIIAILAFCFALVFYRYPMKFLAACAIANMYYILHFWMFCGDSLAARFPATPVLVPIILCAGIVGGFLFTTAAYGVDMLMKSYMDQDSGKAGIS